MWVQSLGWEDPLEKDRSALDKNAMPRHLFEDSVDEGTTRRGTDTPGHRPEKPAGSSMS